MADKPRFKNICAMTRGFNIFAKSAWGSANAHAGMVVASAETFYFVANPNVVIGAAAAVGGAVGGLVAGLAASKRKKGKRKIMPQDVPLVEELDLADLPAKVTRHPDWPVTWEEGPVIVVPRETVKAVRTSFWKGGIDVEVEGVVLRAFTPIFKRKRLVAYLVEIGWGVEGI